MYMLFYNLLKVCGVLLIYCHCVRVGDTSRGHWFIHSIRSFDENRRIYLLTSGTRYDADSTELFAVD